MEQGVGINEFLLWFCDLFWGWVLRVVNNLGKLNTKRVVILLRCNQYDMCRRVQRERKSVGNWRLNYCSDYLSPKEGKVKMLIGEKAERSLNWVTEKFPPIKFRSKPARINTSGGNFMPNVRIIYATHNKKSFSVEYIKLQKLEEEGWVNVARNFSWYFLYPGYTRKALGKLMFKNRFFRKPKTRSLVTYF